MASYPANAITLVHGYDTPTVLVIAKDAVTQQSIVGCLPATYNTCVVESFAAARRAIAEASYVHVALLDIDLEDERGLALLADIKRKFSHGQCLCIADTISAHSAAAAFRAGMSSLLPNPLHHGQLVANTVASAVRIAHERLDEQSAWTTLQQQQERYALAIDGLNDGLWDWKVQSQELYLAPQWKALLGYQDHELPNTIQTWFSRVHVKDADRFSATMDTLLKGGSERISIEYRMRHRDGSVIWVQTRGVAVRNAAGTVVRAAGAQTEITFRKRLENQLHERMFFDSVTGLANRAWFLESLRRALDKMEAGFEIAVALVDLDRFTKVNDGMAPSVGDWLLESVGKRLRAKLGRHDTIARIGGDQFAILFEDIDAKTRANHFVRDVPLAFQKPFTYHDRDVFITASIGISYGDASYENADDILRDAVIAMNRAKADGGNGSAVFEKRMQAHAKNALEMDSALRHAVRREEIIAHYQPIFSLDDGSIVGFESLCRWQHPKLGLLFPLDFLEQAEENGVIVDIGSWCLEESCMRLAEWTASLDMDEQTYMSINVSARQLMRADFIDVVGHSLHKSGIAPGRLVLELTESVFIAHTQASHTNITQLKEMGVRLAMDDFGTGYSSLTYLFRFPLDILKIDKLFVSKLGVDQRHEALVEGVVRLGQTLGLAVVAEGIEKPNQLEVLRRFGCKIGQGWLYSKGVEAKDLPDLWRDHPRW